MGSDAAAGGQSLTLYLLNALQAVLSNRNSLIQTWVSYETARMSLYRDFDLMDIDANGIWTNENDPTAVRIALEYARTEPALSLAIPAGVPDLSPGVGSGSNFYVDVEPGGRVNRVPDAATDRFEEGPLRPSELGDSHPPTNDPSLYPTHPSQSDLPRAAVLSPPPAARRRRKARIPGRAIGIIAGMGLVAAVGYFAVLPAWTSSSRTDRPLVAATRKGTLRITVTERGNLESSVTVDGVCEINTTQIKIIQLVPEGTKVNKGEVVCKFDSSEIDKNIAQQDIKVKQANARIETTRQEMEIQRNKGESDMIAAKVELTLADLDLEKYQKGDYPADTTKQKGEIGLKKKDFEESKNKLDQYRGLMKKGFKTPEQLRIQEMEVARYQLQYESSLLELKVKETYEYRRKTTEFTAKAEQASKKVDQAKATAKAQFTKASSEFESAKATADIEQQQFKEYQKQKDKTVLRRATGDRGVRERFLVRLQPASPRGSDRVLAPEDLHSSRYDSDASEGQYPRIAHQEAEGRAEGRGPDRCVPEPRVRGHGQVRLATGRLDPPLADGRRQAVSHDREAGRPPRLRPEAGHDRGGTSHGRRVERRAHGPRAGDRRA